jgi:adenylate cyclase
MLTWSSVGCRNQNPARAALALNLLSTIKEMGKEDGAPFSLRTGIHYGPVVAGVIGKSKFACDLWGDTKNVASQIESSRTTNSMQVSDAIYRTLKGKLRFRKRGTLDIKGIGAVQPTFYWRRTDV